MKFAKTFESTAKTVPNEWKPFLIHYKELKRIINQIVQELESRGLPSTLLAVLSHDGMLRREYPIDEDPTHPFKSFIQIVLDSSLNSKAAKLSPDNSLRVNLALGMNSSSSIYNETKITVMGEEKDEAESVELATYNNNNDCTNSLHKTFLIQLEADTEFFTLLQSEIEQLCRFAEQNKLDFERKAVQLSELMTKMSSPYEKDMYTWREIFKIYLDAEIFVGDHETDRRNRSPDDARLQLRWFLSEIDNRGLLRKLKTEKSRLAFEGLISLNSDLITTNHFHLINRTATMKILKKHTKRTCLTANRRFLQFLDREPLFNDDLTKLLFYTVSSKFLSIFPQLTDYTCPVCLSISWKPIRLFCGHVFCVRCLIKAERRNMTNCPVCRRKDAVVMADARNLDVSLMNFIKLYFPKEVKAKNKEIEREQGLEFMEAVTAQQWGAGGRNDSCIIS